MPVWIGTSGWQYDHWRETFYPRRCAQRNWLPYYAQRFRTVELNASFYRLPQRSAFEGWAARTPADFVVGVKASRYLTHIKRLREPGEPVSRLLEAARGLGPKLGPVLVQLPGSFTADAERLAATLHAFPPGLRVAVEVRHDSWYCEPVRRILADRGAALCWADRGASWLTPPWRTADWGYVRFHWGADQPGPCYARDRLARCAADLADHWSPEDDVYVYFNNDPLACALRDAAVFAEACTAVGLAPTRVVRLDEVTVAG
jgi:uncharacterized protein YecE (DUF72 family)